MENEELEEVENQFNNARELVEKEIDKVLANPDEHTQKKLDRLWGELAELADMEEGFMDGKSVEYDH